MSLPPLAEFLRWLAELPAVFRAPTAGFSPTGVPVTAVVADLFETYWNTRESPALLQAFRPANQTELEQNRLHWALAACHLLWHPALRAARGERERIVQFFLQELPQLASSVRAEQLVAHEERREELLRRTLRALQLQLPDETAQEAEDRLAQVDSIERQRLLRESAQKEKRAREVREEMLRKAAEEAAAKEVRE